VILGAIQHSLGVGVLAATVLVLGAAYSLWFVKNMVFGAKPDGANLSPLTAHELCGLLTFAILILIIGIYPQPLLTTIDPFVVDLFKHMLLGKG
jgi:NADH-quinone oxidoreductase subunit M